MTPSHALYQLSYTLNAPLPSDEVAPLFLAPKVLGRDGSLPSTTGKNGVLTHQPRRAGIG